MRQDEAVRAERTPEQIEIDRLRAELDHFTKSGIIEIAVRNPSVAEYMAHWEGRALKAESALRETHEAGRRQERERCAGIARNFDAWPQEGADIAAAILSEQGE